MIDTTVFQNKTAVYYTLGCKLNFQRLQLSAKSCGRQESGLHVKGKKSRHLCIKYLFGERQTRNVVRLFIGWSSSIRSFVVVTGCYAQLKPGDVAKIKE